MENLKAVLRHHKNLIAGPGYSMDDWRLDQARKELSSLETDLADLLRLNAALRRDNERLAKHLVKRNLDRKRLDAVLRWAEEHETQGSVRTGIEFTDQGWVAFHYEESGSTCRVRCENGREAIDAAMKEEEE